MKSMTTSKWVLSCAFVAASLLPSSIDAGPRHGKGREPPIEDVDVPHLNHTVQPGETLFSIAERYYGTGYNWSQIQEYNPWIDHKNLSPGTVIFIPEPRRGGGGQTTSSKGGGLWEAIFGSRAESNEAEFGGSVAFNPPPAPSSRGGNSLKGMFNELAQVQFLGVPFFRLIFLIASWFIGHMAIQGGLVWFCAHMAFVKDVSFKKALRSTAQLETLAMVCLVILSITGLLLIYVGTAPPGKPMLQQLFGIAEEYLGHPTGMAVSGLLLVGLYVFLGIRFIPPAFGVPNAQGWAVVLMSVLIPHLIFLYLVGHRLGFIG